MEKTGEYGMKRVNCIVLVMICLALVLSGCQDKNIPTETIPETECAEAACVKQLIMPDYLNEYYYGTPETMDNYWERVIVSALYEDGTVGVACKEEYRQHYEIVSRWQNIREIWMADWEAEIWGLTEDGTVVTTSGMDVSHLKNVQDFVDGYARLADGSMEPLGGGEKLPVHNAKEIQPVHPDYDWGTWVLCEDGSVCGVNVRDEFGNVVDCMRLDLKNVQDIDVIDLKLCVYKSDGTVFYGDMAEEELERLHGSVKISGSEGFQFGLAADRNLRLGSEMEKEYLNEAWGRYYPTDGFRDMQEVRTWPPVLLHEDGTVWIADGRLNQAVRTWCNVEKIALYEDYGYVTLYGLREDGTVIVYKTETDEIIENYKDWVLEDIYAEPYSGCIGICADGSFVGDYAFEDLDYSRMR